MLAGWSHLRPCICNCVHNSLHVSQTCCTLYLLCCWGNPGDGLSGCSVFVCVCPLPLSHYCWLTSTSQTDRAIHTVYIQCVLSCMYVSDVNKLFWPISLLLLLWCGDNGHEIPRWNQELWWNWTKCSDNLWRHSWSSLTCILTCCRHTCSLAYYRYV